MFDRVLCLLMLLPLMMANAAFGLDCGGPDAPCRIDGGQYHIVVPEKWKGGPAVIHLHGYGSSGATVVGNDGFASLFTARGYALIAPTALPWTEGEPSDWSVRDGWQTYPRRDAAFLRKVLADAVVRAGIDPDRVLLTGFSRGGSMVWDVACLMPDFARGYAPAAGGFWLPMPEDCSGPADILHVHGFADPIVPLEGRAIHNAAEDFIFTQADIWAGLQLWRRENGCPPNAAEIEITEAFWHKRWQCESAGLELVLHKGKHGLPPGWATTVLDWFERLDP